MLKRYSFINWVLFGTLIVTGFNSAGTYASASGREVGVELPPIQVIEKENFRALVALIEEKIGPDFSSIRKKFVLELLVNGGDNPYIMKAEADREGRNAIVRLWGGMPRSPLMSIDGIALVICHEIGHHLGGAPKRLDQTWSSAEGQADYWGANVCLKKLWTGQNHQDYLPKEIKPEATALCHGSKVSPDDFSYCLRALMASKSMVDVLKEMKHMTRNIDFDEIPATPDSGQTFTDHPSIACRFRTYIAAVTNLDRPRCWFKD